MIWVALIGAIGSVVSLAAVLSAAVGFHRRRALVRAPPLRRRPGQGWADGPWRHP